MLSGKKLCGLPVLALGGREGCVCTWLLVWCELW